MDQGWLLYTDQLSDIQDKLEDTDTKTIIRVKRKRCSHMQCLLSLNPTLQPPI